jgi:hypothetical protein
MTKAKNPPNSRANAAQTASDQRTILVKELTAKENAATDAKTARLKALRLEREAEEATARAAAPPAPAKPRKRSVRAS